MDKAYVSIVKTHKHGYYLLAAKTENTWEVQGFHTLQDGLYYYERGYAEFHKRSYESSISACINWIFLQPSIVEVNSIDELKPFIKELKVILVGTIAGRMNGIPLLPEVENLWEAGTKPSLINEEMIQI